MKNQHAITGQLWLPWRGSATRLIQVRSMTSKLFWNANFLVSFCGLKTCYCRYLLLMLLFSHPVTPFVVSFLCFAKLLSPYCFWAAAHLPLPNVVVSCDFLLSGRQISSLNRIAINNCIAYFSISKKYLDHIWHLSKLLHSRKQEKPRSHNLSKWLVYHHRLKDVS